MSLQPEQTTGNGRRPQILKTDVGNAQRLARNYGHGLRYVERWNKWLAWDDRRWSDRQSDAQAMAKKNAIALLSDAVSVANDRERREVVTHAEASQSASRIRAALFLAQSEPGIAIEPNQLDVDPWLLNCINGTINLQTGSLHAHRRDDLITKLCPTNFDGKAACPHWLSFLNEVFCGDVQLIRYVQKLLGYCLTGTVHEQILAMFVGAGANGKTTLINAIMEVLGGDYSAVAPRNLLMIRGVTNEHPTEFASLYGMRFVAASETEDGRRLSEAVVKAITGDGMITTRRMRENFWKFSPTHKLVLATNHRPEVKGTDLGIWRRLVEIPFTRTFTPEQQDKQLAEKLRAEYPGILAWCVQGCLQWQAEGLTPPSIVTAATSSYRADQDAVGRFLAECCDALPEARVKAAQLYPAYVRWCDEAGEHAITKRQFGERMTERGIERYTNNGVWYRGVGIINGRTEGHGT